MLRVRDRELKAELLDLDPSVGVLGNGGSPNRGTSQNGKVQNCGYMEGE